MSSAFALGSGLLGKPLQHAKANLHYLVRPRQQQCSARRLRTMSSKAIVQPDAPTYNAGGGNDQPPGKRPTAFSPEGSDSTVRATTVFMAAIMSRCAIYLDTTSKLLMISVFVQGPAVPPGWLPYIFNGIAVVVLAVVGNVLSHIIVSKLEAVQSELKEEIKVVKAETKEWEARVYAEIKEVKADIKEVMAEIQKQGVKVTWALGMVAGSVLTGFGVMLLRLAR